MSKSSSTESGNTLVIYTTDSKTGSTTTTSASAGYFFNSGNSGDLYGTQAIDFAVYSGYAFGSLEVNSSSSKSGGIESTCTVSRTVSSSDSKTGSTSSATYTETLHDVERLKFDDGYLALDLNIDDSAGAALAILYMAFDAIPDENTAGKWIKASDVYFNDGTMDSSDMTSLAQEMLNYYAPSGVGNRQLVELIYNNVIGDNPSFVGQSTSIIDYYTSAIVSGIMSQASLLSAVAQTDYNQNNYADLIGQGWQYQVQDSKLG